MKNKYLSKGIIKSIPGIEYLYKFHKATGGTDKARYCYSVWLRHLVLAHEHGYTSIPKKIAELGPGDSLGIGLSALISGADHYWALDAVKFTNVERNLEIFDELVMLFKQKSAISTTNEFPNLKPELTSYNFPAHILTDEHLEKVLNENRLNKIRDSIKAMNNPSPEEREGYMIKYQAPWKEANTIERETIDMIITQTVLQHLDDLEEIYRIMYTWLKKNGIMSHMIDLSALDLSDEWDGHWTYSDFEWKILKGRNIYLINREPYSKHIQCLHDLNLKIIDEIKIKSEPTLQTQKSLAKKFRNMSMEDLSISGLFIQAVKLIEISAGFF